MASPSERAKRAEGRLDRLRSESQRIAGYLVEQVVAGTTSTALGYARGRMTNLDKEEDEFSLGGVAGEVWAAGLADLIGFAGLGGKKYSHLAIHLGTGAICSYGTLNGFTFGQKAREAVLKEEGKPPETRARIQGRRENAASQTAERGRAAR